MISAKDLITSDNVIKTITKNKYVCFILKNGFTVKLDPNDVPDHGVVLRQGGKQNA